MRADLPRRRHIVFLPKGAWLGFALAWVLSVASGLWLFALGLPLGLAIHLIRGLCALRWTLPRELAEAAAATSTDTDMSHEEAAALLVAIARPHQAPLRHAERLLAHQPGTTAAQQGLAAARHMLAAERVAERIAAVSALRLLITPTAAALVIAGLILLLLDERTDGPVLAQPWRTWAAVAAAAITSATLALTARHGSGH